MAMIGASTITNANGDTIATGDQGNDDVSPTVQVVIAQDNGLQPGAFYTITLQDGTGWQGACYVRTDGTLADFDTQNATRF